MTSRRVTLEALRTASLAELEALFALGDATAVPRGSFRGTFLRYLETRGARRLRWRAFYELIFRPFRFGVDFDTRRWSFGVPSLQIAHFEPRLQPSRWRDTQAVALHYQRSRLPGIVRGLLYDEVKPLSEDLVLGIGGVNAERDDGDHFFFALSR